MSASSRFPLGKLALARGFEGVRAAYPVYIESYMALLRKPQHQSRPIRVVGFNVRADLFQQELMPTLVQYRQLLLDPGTAIIDDREQGVDLRD